MESEPIVGDYVTCNKTTCLGVVYRITAINKQKYQNWCVLTPVFGLFDAHVKRGERHQSIDDIEKIDLVRAGLEYMKVVTFIENLAKHEAGACQTSE